MTGPEPCGARTRDVHGDVVCDLNPDHRGAHSGEVMAGVNLSWSAAPPLSPREREIVDRFENASDSPYFPDEGDFAQKANGNSNIHIVHTVIADDLGEHVIMACGQGWDARALAHVDTDGGGPRDCRKCWDLF